MDVIEVASARKAKYNILYSLNSTATEEKIVETVPIEKTFKINNTTPC